MADVTDNDLLDYEEEDQVKSLFNARIEYGPSYVASMITKYRF